MLAVDRASEINSPVHPRLGKPQSVRIHNFLLGERDNYDADREVAQQVETVFPNAGLCARTSREFMHRSTRYLARQGIRQFLDIGVGFPSEPDLYQIAQEVAPDARIVHVDNDPLVLAHARALLARTSVIDADVTTPEAILDAEALHETFDLTQPVALSLHSLMHFIPDDHDPHGVVKTLMDALAPGSYLVMSHMTADLEPEAVDKTVQIYRDSGLTYQPRSQAEFAQFFDRLDLVSPGIDDPYNWRPDGIQDLPRAGIRELPRAMDVQISAYAAVGRN